MSRTITIIGFVAAAALGAGAVLLFNIFVPRPPPRILSAWQVFPMSTQTPVATCKEGFARAFRAAGFSNVSLGAADGIHVQATDNGYSATGICMPRREAAAAIVTGVDAAVVDTRLDTISAAVLGRAR